jgi:LemA protein
MGLALAVLLALGLLLAFTYNSLARLRLLAANAWADIDVQLKRRHDLIPALVATVKGHAGYEKGTLESVVQARNRAASAGGPAAAGEAEGVLAAQVRQIFALAEAYPDLKAAESFLSLQRSLTEIEDHIQNARRYYNAVVRDLNTRIAQFPTNLMAGALGFRPREFFGLSDAAEQAVPSVDLKDQGSRSP